MKAVAAFPGYLASAAREEVEQQELAAALVEPSVSVVVPTYNHRAYIVQLLDALGRLDGVPFEVVVVDDGSGDGTFPVVAERARQLGLAGRAVRLPRNRGRSVARNVGITRARADVIAFIDSDCLPAPGWLGAGLAALDGDPRIGIIPGATLPCPDQPRPMFSHYIEIRRFEGSFSTCNVLYRRQALLDAGGFDPGVVYWEDCDLGWRARRAGWQDRFVREAVVYHQVLPLSPKQWLLWPLHFRYEPAKAASYPEYRRYLFLGIWVHWFHALFDLAVLSLVLGLAVHPMFILLSLPYLVAFPARHGVRGRWPPLKIAANLAWDAVSLGVLAASSARHRSVVL